MPACPASPPGATPGSFTFWQRNHPKDYCEAMMEACQVSREIHRGKLFCPLQGEDLDRDDE